MLTCLYSIATAYNGPLEAAHAQIDDDRYDMVEWSSAGQRKMEDSGARRARNIETTNNYPMSSANVLV